jgi:exopolyphosphatase/guanosine-5'-triphosphate,3'-diphosphate pyrophosphatase
MRVAVVDIGTNSTRLLIADVDPGGSDPGSASGSGAASGIGTAPAPASVTELLRQSRVTRLGAGVDAHGGLSPEAVERTCVVLADYRALIDSHACEANLAVLTSAVRDASDGAAFAERVRNEYGLDARTLSGDEEAAMTFLGAMSDREPSPEPTVVIDIGGGSTEFVVGHDHTAGFHVSLQAGVVRMSERHIRSDPPAPAELQSLALDTRAIFLDGLPPEERAPVVRGIAVAGTATAAAAIDLELDPYDPVRVHGHPLLLATVEMLLARLADMDEAQRRRVVGLHPDRAPTIVAGMILLSEALRAFELDRVEVSEHDILRGGAVRLASRC